MVYSGLVPMSPKTTPSAARDSAASRELVGFSERMEGLFYEGCVLDAKIKS
jgi:hypothetical protein